MKLISIMMISLALGVSGCAKKKKAAKPKDKSDKAKGGKGAPIIVTSKFAIKISDDSKKITIGKADADNAKKQKNGDCDLTSLNDKLDKEKSELSIALAEKKLSIKGNGDVEVLAGEVNDKKDKTIDGKYKAKDGIEFTITVTKGNGELQLSKSCAAKK